MYCPKCHSDQILTSDWSNCGLCDWCGFRASVDAFLEELEKEYIVTIHHEPLSAPYSPTDPHPTVMGGFEKKQSALDVFFDTLEDYRQSKAVVQLWETTPLEDRCIGLLDMREEDGK